MAVPTFYFHGVPGSAAELDLFAGVARPDWQVVERATLPQRWSAAQRFDALADRIESVAARGPVRLVGFSLGSFVALEVAGRLPGRALTLDLVSAAAPLQTGDFLDAMAGKAVFSLAAKSPAAFQLLTLGQSGATRIAPQYLLQAIFASAQGEDRKLASDAYFRRGMIGVLAHSLGAGRASYCAEITGYVKDWSTTLDAFRHPVTLWHGSEDNWAPPGMAHALAGRLGPHTRVNLLPGLSHYSTLRAVLSNSKARAIN